MKIKHDMLKSKNICMLIKPKIICPNGYVQVHIVCVVNLYIWVMCTFTNEHIVSTGF